MSTLHITNGDSTVALLKAAEIKGDMLPWRDILHMGPVPSDHDLHTLSMIRAEFLASLNWGDKDALYDDFRQRDRTLENAKDYEHILLWFEHDLYDQLQLLQLLDWFNQHLELLPKLALINPNKHLGYHTVDEVPDLLSQQKAVTKAQLTLSTQVWKAYRQPTPQPLSQCLKRDLSVLPYLRSALIRTLAELPHPATGLNQTEASILQLLGKNEDTNGLTKIELFKQYNALEPDAFHGDMGFFWYLEQMLIDTPQLLIQSGDKVTLTPAGKDCLDAACFWQRKYNVQQWLGGYALGKDSNYYWDTEKQQLSEGPNSPYK